MPISAIGTADAWVRSRDRGFTLVELMVVLAIVGTLAAAAVLAIPDPQGNVRSEAVRFAARARAVQERAVTDNRPGALVITRTGYSFELRAQGRWRPAEEKPFTWKKGTQALFEGPERRILFDSTGFAENARLRLRRGGEEAVVEVSDGGRVHVLP